MFYIKNALTRKNLMALTGLFLSFFLIIHLGGNLQLLVPEAQARLQYNWYSHLLAGNIFIEVIAIVLYCCLVLHAVFAVYLAIIAKKANSSGFSRDRRGRASTWYSRNMMFLGGIIFFFLIIHFKDFWYHYKFGALPLDENGNKDLYTLVISSFNQLWYVVLYVIAIVALGYHLLHGVFSAHKTLGLYNPLYTKIVKILGLFFALLLTGGYIIIPILIYLKN